MDAAAAAEEGEGDGTVALEAATAEARRFVGKVVRVEWVATDVTHRRNLAAVTGVLEVAAAARRGIRLPGLSALRGLLGVAEEQEGGGGEAAARGAEATGAEATGAEATAAEGSAGGGAAGGGGLAPRREKERSFDSGLDQWQRRAAAAALAEPLSLLQGPPGSGKSRVVVEAVRRAAAQGQRVLVCAPSNNAVDQLALRLQRADPALRLLRYGAGVEQRADGTHRMSEP